MIYDNSTQTDPKGRTPPNSAIKTGIVENTLLGMMRAILFGRADGLMGLAWTPMKPPTNTMGVATQTQRKKMYKIVQKLTAEAA